jgi:predicted transcriptional regulator
MPGRKPVKKLDAYIGIRLPRETLRRLQGIASFQDRSMSAQALRALETYIADPEGCERLRQEAEERKG